MKTQPLKTALLTTSLMAMFAFGAINANEGGAKKAERMYTDPITGEAKYAEKLLSEMSDTEKALLSNEEYRALKELEAKLTTEKKAKGQGE